MASIVAAAHVKFDFVDEQFSTTGSLQPAAQLANYNSLEAVAPGSIDYIEGLNEINNQPITYDGSGSSGQGQDELNAALAYQQTIYQEVTSDPALSGIGIAYFTGYDAGSIPVGPDPFKTSGLATADTQHPYPQFGQAPSYWVNPAPAFPNLTAEDIAGGAPMVYTETGYSSVPTVGGSGVDEATQARYSLDLLLDDAKNGIKTTYIYDINDDGPVGSSVDDGFGLFYAYDNTADPNGAKPAATAIHNMNVILADTGAQASSFTLNAIDFSVAGQTATSNNMEMQRSDNTSIIALWDEQPIWNDQTATEIAPTPHNETITFGNGSGLYNVAVYDPLTGTVPVRTATDVNAMTVSVSSDPLFIEVTPVTTTSTTTSDTVILNLGEAQASGVDAEFQVSINGTIVGTGTVGAAEMSGASDDVTYTGDFGTGSVDVAVTFLNGFAGNLLDAGRTLYVNSISVNGQADFENAVLEFDTTDTYTLQASPPTTPATEATPDTLTLNLSDTPLNGQGALFEVAVNGSLVGDPQLVTATAASGHSQNFTFTGDFGSDPTVTLDFINGFSGYAPAFGEELVVNSITLDGLATAENADQFYYGPASYTVAAGNTKGSTTPTKPTTPTTPVKTTPSAPTTTSDTVILNLGEAQASGVDAEFQVSINGTIVGTGTVGAAEMSGASDDVTYTGDFGTGSVDVAVTFLNGFAGNLLDAGRTLYVNSISVNGQADFENAVLEFDTTDTYTLQASPPTTPATEATPDTLTLNLSDTPLNGQGALFEVAVNGSLVGDPQLVTATAASGHSQNFTFTGDFGSDPTVTLDFINGFSGYAPAFGEELVVNSITLDGLATAENADQFYYGPASYTVAAGNTKGSTTPTKPTTPATPVTTTPSGATIPMTQYVAPSTSGIGTDPMVTYNWNPATQLRSFLSAEAQGTASIVAIGDSTTSGIGSDSGNTEDIAGSYPSELTYWLNQDQIAAQDANFLGNNNDGGDTQVDLLGSTIWSGAQGASGQAIQTAGVGDGFSFTPYNPLTGNEVAVTYYSSGGGTLAVDVNGTQVGTIAIGNNYTMETTELSIPLQLVNTVTVISTTPTADFLEGAAVSNTKSAAIQIYNAGQSGGTAEGANASETVGSLGNSSGEIPDTIQLNPSLVLINYGINDINDGLETPDQAASYVKQMVADFQAKGIDTIIIVPTPFASTYASEFPSYVNDLEGIAAQMNVPLINLSATYDNSEADLAAAGLMHDGIHPGAQLYADIGSGIAGLISKAIQSN